MKLPIKDIKTNPRNPRLIKDDKFKRLVQSLKDFPEMADVREIVINKDHIVLGGNMRLKAMQEAGWTEAPVKVVDWTQEKQDEFVVKDNASFGEWDWDELANQYEVAELIEWGVDLPESLLPEEEVEEDEAPEVSSEPAVSKLGEIYQLGRHRVMCGDSTDKESMDRLLKEIVPITIFTDPPYNINYSDMSGKFDKIENDKLTDDDFTEFLMQSFAYWRTSNGYICCNWKYYHLFYKAMWDSGIPVKSCIVWDKERGVQNLDKYHKQHEFILYFGEFGGQKTLGGDVYKLSRETSDLHPTMKPIELCAKFIKDSTKKEDIILDIFLGSGSTLIACEQTDRTCYGMELDPKYVDVIRKRYHKFVTGEVDGWELATPAIM